MSQVDLEQIRDRCTLPPEGWYCTRPAGHDGPCAAKPWEPSQDKPLIERYKRQTVLWLFENVQASFAEIAAVLSTTREEGERLYQEAKADRDRIFNSRTPFR